MESHRGSPSDRLPPITVTIANNDVDFVVRLALSFVLFLINSTIHYCFIKYDWMGLSWLRFGDQELTFFEHVKTMCWTYFYDLYRILAVRSSLCAKTASTLLHALICRRSTVVTTIYSFRFSQLHSVLNYVDQQVGGAEVWSVDLTSCWKSCKYSVDLFMRSQFMHHSA